MNTKLFLFYIAFLSFCLFSCKDNNLIDINYPTTIHKLSHEEFMNQLNAYYERNQYISSALDQFGFCGGDGSRNITFPVETNELLEDEIISIIKGFISNNKRNIGVNNPNHIDFINIQKENNTNWNASTRNQIIDTIEVLNTKLVFHGINENMWLCSGNWYPEIYIPNDFQIDSQHAKNSLMGKEVVHYNIAGSPYWVQISSSDIEASSTRLVIYPVITDETIKLHIVWEIHLPSPIHYKIYVDVMTGVIVNERPTIIS